VFEPKKPVACSDPVIIIYPPSVSGIIPGSCIARGIGRRSLETRTVDIDYIAALIRVVRQCLPWQRVIAVTDSKETTKAHNRILIQFSNKNLGVLQLFVVTSRLLHGRATLLLFDPSVAKERCASGVGQRLTIGFLL
jgi:hypothetical protein